MTEWHAGRTVGRTLYKGDGPDDLIGVMDSRELAAYVVVAVNERARVREFLGAVQTHGWDAAVEVLGEPFLFEEAQP